MKLLKLLPRVIILICGLLIINPAKADKSFRDHRYSSFQTLPASKDGDIVFIGNSITNMMNWNELFVKNKRIKNRGTSGAFTKEILENLECMISGHPSKVFVMIGTNDLGMEGDEFQPEAVAYRIKRILGRIRNEVPDAEVYYQNILPSLNGKRTEAKTTLTNSIVKDWIESSGDSLLTYIDLYSHFVDEKGYLKNTDASFSEDSYSYDGLHLSQKGYNKWAHIISEYINDDSVIPVNTPNIWGNLTKSTGMRVTHFGSLPVYSSDILLIGDEMIHGGEWWELLQTPDFKDRGIGWGFPGINLEAINSIIDPILKGNQDKGVVKEEPKAIVLYAGMADLQAGDSIIEIKDKYGEIINKIKKVSDNVPVFIMTLLPTGKPEIDEKIKFCNEELKSLTSDDSTIYIIDLYKSFIDKNNDRISDYFTGLDTPYLNGMGYVKVSNIIAEAINDKFGTCYTPVSEEDAIVNLNNYVKQTEEKNGTFTVFDNKSSEVPYRIPAIGKNKNGDLIAVADYRYSKADIGMAKNGKLDLRYRIYDAEKNNWGEIKTLVSTIDEDSVFIAFGDPCIVADRESDKVLVTSCSGNVSFPKGTHENHQGWARFYSEDGGKSWSQYEEMANQAFDLLDRRPDGNINAFFIGSGKITQSKKVKTGDSYRIYCAALVKVNDNKTKVNYVFYSDDFGKNWNLLGDVNDCPIPFGADEPKTEELPDGSILVSSRISGGRYYNVFHFSDIEKGEGSWDLMAKSNEENGGIKASTNACNGETLCIPVIRNSDGEATFLLLQSVPMNKDGKRANVGINYKDLGPLNGNYTSANIASDWDGSYEVTPNSSGYSTMVLDKDNNIAFFYEENAFNGGYDMIYKKISIKDLTHGEYSFKNRN